MIEVRKAQDRGQANYGWLNTHYTFSFANYYDPNYLGFRSLRVINEDRVIGGAGFETHGHRDMEIITYILEGCLEHKDSLGNGSLIKPGEIQRMTAGRGILHSEFNHSPTDLVHLLQIWIIPSQRGLNPSYEQQTIDLDKTPVQLQLIAAPPGKNGTVTIHQDVNLYAAKLTTGDRLSFSLSSERYGWIQVARGAIILNGITLDSGDGAAISEETNLDIEATTGAEILFFDLA